MKHHQKSYDTYGALRRISSCGHFTMLDLTGLWTKLSNLQMCRTDATVRSDSDGKTEWLDVTRLELDHLRVTTMQGGKRVEGLLPILLRWPALLSHDVHDLGCTAMNYSKKVKLNNTSTVPSHCTLLQQKKNLRTHIHDLKSHQRLNFWSFRECW